jgi:hypothetical protein
MSEPIFENDGQIFYSTPDGLLIRHVNGSEMCMPWPEVRRMAVEMREWLHADTELSTEEWTKAMRNCNAAFGTEAP